MPDLIIYGASDDLVEIEGVFEEEFTVPKGGWCGRVEAPNGEYMFVTVEWCSRTNREGWALGVDTDGGPFPSWPSRYVRSADVASLTVGYIGDPDNPALILDVPVGTVVKTEDLDGGHV